MSRSTCMPNPCRQRSSWARIKLSVITLFCCFNSCLMHCRAFTSRDACVTFAQARMLVLLQCCSHLLFTPLYICLFRSIFASPHGKVRTKNQKAVFESRCFFQIAQNILFYYRIYHTYNNLYLSIHLIFSLNKLFYKYFCFFSFFYSLKTSNSSFF